MIRLALLCGVIQLAHCSCPVGYELVRDGECRGKQAMIVTEWDVMTDAVIKKCNKIDGKPIIIHNHEHQTYWSKMAVYEVPNNVPIGLVCNTKTGNWIWSDGSKMKYKPAGDNYDAALDKNCRTDYSWTIDPKGYWDYGNAHKETPSMPVYCTTQLQPPAAGSDGCESFDDDKDDGICYQIGTTIESWSQAKRLCTDFGSDLASVHNAQENSFIRRLAVSKGAVNGVYLGASRYDPLSSAFSWTDGSNWDYNNFYPGFPVDGAGDCLVMDTSGTTGNWVNSDCNSKQAVACQRRQHYTSTCTGGPWNEGDIIYSPGFPVDASIPCDYLLSVDPGEKVQLEILLLEANSCCDRVVITDNYIGGNVIANLTGEINGQVYTTQSSNFMRVSWQPDGGVNVRGMMMIYRGIF